MAMEENNEWLGEEKEEWQNEWGRRSRYRQWRRMRSRGKR